MQAKSCSQIILDRDAEAMLLAQHRRDGARQVLNSLLDGLFWFQVGFALTSSIGCLRTLCKMHYQFELWVVFAPLWIGHIITSTSHISSFEKLRRFLFVPPLSIAQSRGALLRARREKIPFVIMWIRFTGQIFIAFICIVLSEILLYLHFHQLETGSQDVITMGFALLPLSSLAALNVLHGILCKGSPLRFFTSLAGLIQLQLLSWRMDHHPLFGISSWFLVLSPSLILTITLFAVLVRYLIMYYSRQYRHTNHRHNRFIDDHQAMVAWCYVGGMFFFGLFLCFLLDHLEKRTLQIGVMATLCLLLAQSLVLKGVHLAATRSVLVLEDYVGDEVPMPLFQDPQTGYWVVSSELREDVTPFPFCINCLSCCFSSICCIDRGEDEVPMLGARELENTDIPSSPISYADFLSQRE